VPKKQINSVDTIKPSVPGKVFLIEITISLYFKKDNNALLYT